MLNIYRLQALIFITDMTHGSKMNATSQAHRITQVSVN